MSVAERLERDFLNGRWQWRDVEREHAVLLLDSDLGSGDAASAEPRHRWRDGGLGVGGLELVRNRGFREILCAPEELAGRGLAGVVAREADLVSELGGAAVFTDAVEGDAWPDGARALGLPPSEES